MGRTNGALRQDIIALKEEVEDLTRDIKSLEAENAKLREVGIDVVENSNRVYQDWGRLVEWVKERECHNRTMLTNAEYFCCQPTCKHSRSGDDFCEAVRKVVDG